MSELDFREMRVELIRGGVAPKYIERTLMELNTHYRELKNQAIIDGLAENEAQERARQAIGNESTLVKEILSKPELKSLSWRFPKTLFILAPLLALVLSIGIFLGVLILLFIYLPSMTEMDPGTSPALWIKMLLEISSIFNLYLMPSILAVFTILFAKQRMVDLKFPIIGIALLTIIGSGWAYSIEWPTAVAQGNMSFNWGYSFLPRYISGDHDMKNYVQIMVTLALSFIAWQVYNPFKLNEVDSEH
jgi:hypothetical protein